MGEKVRFLTGRQLAKKIRCEEKTIYLWKEKGKIKPIGRIGHSDIYDLTSIEKLKKEVEKHQGNKRYIGMKKIRNLIRWFEKG